MMPIVYVKVVDGSEYRVIEVQEEVFLDWKYPGHPWETLYFANVFKDGVKRCIEKLGEEIRDLELIGV